MGQIEIEAAKKFADIGMTDIAEMSHDDVPVAHYETAAREGSAFVVEARDGALAGFSICAVMDGEPYLAELDVHPAHQGKGLGRMLIAAVEDWALKRGQSSLLLSTFRDVPWNAPYYARLGFVALEANASTGPDMEAQRAHERETILDMTTRVFMRKQLRA